MILERSSQPSMDQDKAYKAGITWITIYDLSSAIRNEEIKNPSLISYFTSAISKKVDVQEKEIVKLLSALPSGQLPNVIYNHIYGLFDKDYRPMQEQSKDTIEGFHLLALRMFEFSYLGKLLTDKRWQKDA